MKRILLLGATGRTGRQVLDYALERGHEVVALVRDKHKIDPSNKLTVIQGLSTDINDVRRAMRGCDAVINTLGALHASDILSLRKIDPPHTLEISMRNIVECMNELGIKRVISQSTFGAGDSYQYTPWVLKMVAKHTKFSIVVRDHNMQEDLLMDSKLDWTIVRPVGLNDHKELKTLEVTYDAPPPTRSISRRQVAKFMVDALETNFFINKAPTLSEKD